MSYGGLVDGYIQELYELKELVRKLRDALVGDEKVTDEELVQRAIHLRELHRKSKEVFGEGEE